MAVSVRQAASDRGLWWVTRACASTASRTVSASRPKVASAAGSRRMAAPLPASCSEGGAQGSPVRRKRIRLRRTVLPMSTGLPRIHWSNACAASRASTRPPDNKMASPSARLMVVSSVTMPGRSLSQPPPVRWRCRPIWWRISLGVRNSTVAPSASPTARPRYAPSARASSVSGAEGAGPNWRMRFRTPGQSMLAGRDRLGRRAPGRRKSLRARTVAGR